MHTHAAVRAHVLNVLFNDATAERQTDGTNCSSTRRYVTEMTDSFRKFRCVSQKKKKKVERSGIAAFSRIGTTKPAGSLALLRERDRRSAGETYHFLQNWICHTSQILTVTSRPSCENPQPSFPPPTSTTTTIVRLVRNVNRAFCVPRNLGENIRLPSYDRNRRGNVCPL